MMLVQGALSLELRGLASTLVGVILSEWRGGNGIGGVVMSGQQLFQESGGLLRPGMLLNTL